MLFEKRVWNKITWVSICLNHLSGVMFSRSPRVGSFPDLGQTKDYDIGICCFSA